MSQISKCPKVTHVLTYWEASGEVSELTYKSLLFISSKRSYCITSVIGKTKNITIWNIFIESVRLVPIQSVTGSNHRKRHYD